MNRDQFRINTFPRLGKIERNMRGPLKWDVIVPLDYSANEDRIRNHVIILRRSATALASIGELQSITRREHCEKIQGHTNQRQDPLSIHKGIGTISFINLQLEHS